MFKKINQKLLFLFLGLIAVVAMTAAQVVPAEAARGNEVLAQDDFSDLRIAMLTSGPINDEGWNQTAYEGLKALEAAGAEIANTENVAQADQLDLIRSYADQGFNIIIGHGFEYGDALTAAAEEYPDVSFLQIGGIAQNGKNLASYVFQPGQGGYVAGILAGLMNKDGKLGGVGAVEIPTIAADFNAFKIAAQTVNPNVADVPVAYTGSWVDIPKAKEAAIAQIDSGVELILANGDNANVGAIEAAKENGKVYMIGWTRDQSHLAPDLVLTSLEQRVDNILVEAIKEIKTGGIEWTNHVTGIAEQALALAPFNEVVPAEVATEVNNVVQAMADGLIVLDDAGNVVKDDYHLPDLSGLKVAMLTSGPINDEGWNQTAYEGLQVLESAGAEIANTENVAQADQLDLIRSYGDQGFNVIIGHGFEFGDALTSAATEYPEVSFIQIGGIAENGTNLVSYVFQAGQGGYAAGILAGLMDQEGKLGGVGAVEIPTIAADFNAFKIAAQTVNPNVADVPVAYTGSWVDIPKAKEAAIAQIDSGVQLILANGDNANVGAIEAAKENGQTYVIGWTRDQSHLAPDLVLTSNEQRVDHILVEAIKEIKAGTIEWKNHTVGFKEGAQTFSPFNKAVPAEVATEVNNVIKALADGLIVLDDAGNVVKDDYHLPDLSGLKVAMLTSGPINDEGWNQTAYEGLQVLESAGAEIANTENVAQADQLDLIRSYGDQGFNVIIGHGFEYGDALTSAATEYPEVSFIQIGGIAENGTNLVSYVFRAGEGGYAAGILAGLINKEGKLGGVGAVEIPTIAADFNAFKMAAQTVNPNVADVPVAYTGSWVDIPKAKEAAIAQIDSGVELIMANGDNANVGAIEAASENGQTYVIGWTRDQSHLAPDLVLTSLEQRVDHILVAAIKEIKAGTIEWKNHVVGFKEGAQALAPFNQAVSAEVSAEVNNAVKALVDGLIVLDDTGAVVTDEYHK